MTPLSHPTSDTAVLTRAAHRLLQGLYQPGHNYAKAGVMLMDLQSADREQGVLDLGKETQAHRPRLMQALDTLNERYGRGTLQLASAGAPDTRKGWGMKQERLTPQYTTDWGALAVAG